MCEFNQIPDLYNKIADLQVQIETARQKVVTMADDIDFQKDINDAGLESEKQVQEQIKTVDQKVVGLAFEMASQQEEMATMVSRIQDLDYRVFNQVATLASAHMDGLTNILRLLTAAMPKAAE